MIDPVSPVAHYFKMQKRVKHIEARKKKLLKELRRDQKNMAKIGEKIGGKKQKIAMLEMEIRMSKLGLNVDESPKLGRHVKRRKSRNVQQGGICPPDTGSQSKIVAAEVSYDPNGGKNAQQSVMRTRSAQQSVSERTGFLRPVIKYIRVMLTLDFIKQLCGIESR